MSARDTVRLIGAFLIVFGQYQKWIISPGPGLSQLQLHYRLIERYMGMTSTIFADLDTAHCVYMRVCLCKNGCHQYFGLPHCYVLPSRLCVLYMYIVYMCKHAEMHTTISPKFAVCACNLLADDPSAGLLHTQRANNDTIQWVEKFGALNQQVLQP